jgi:hypothetical protein
MKDAQNDFSSEDEAKGMDVHFGVDGSNSCWITERGGESVIA